MRIERFDLSVSRTVPQPSKNALRSGVCQIVRCDSPASILIDSASGERIPAIVGAVIDSFNNLYVENIAGGGFLVLAFYNCSVGAPSLRFPFSTLLAYGVGDTASTVEAVAETPGPDWSVVITRWQAGFTSSAPTTWPLRMSLRQLTPAGGLSDLLDHRMILEGGTPGDYMGETVVTGDFSTPLVLAPGWGAQATVNFGGVGISRFARIYCQIIR